MKKQLLILSTLTALLLSGCSLQTTLPPVRDEDQLAEALPEQLACVTIDGKSLDCSVVHLAIKNRNTDTLRRTDQADCVVELAGEGVDIQYNCTLGFSYTQNGGWGLDSWTLGDLTSIQISDEYLQEGFASANIDRLTQDGYGDVTVADTVWDPTTLSLTQAYSVSNTAGSLSTAGQVVVSGQLQLEPDQGLTFTWNSQTNTDGILLSANIQGTVWTVSGSIDGQDASMAFQVDEYDVENHTITLTYVTPESSLSVGGYTEEEFYKSREYYLGFYEDWDDYLAHKDDSSAAVSSSNRTLSPETYTTTWYSDQSGEVAFCIEQGSNYWDIFFTADDQWVRLNNSYLGKLESAQLPESGQLGDLLTDSQDTDSKAGNSLRFTMQTVTRTYQDSEGHKVYTQTVNYPVFSASSSELTSFAAELNTNIQNNLASFIADNDYGTSESAMDQLYQRKSGTSTLPLSDELNISVTYNDNGYLSLLWETRTFDGSQESLSYRSNIYQLERGSACTYTSFLSCDSYDLSALICQYYGQDKVYWSTYSTADTIKATVLTNEGISFYFAPEGSAVLQATIPYTDSHWENLPGGSAARAAGQAADDSQQAGNQAANPPQEDGQQAGD